MSIGRTGIVALVPEAFSRPWSTRHHVLTRLARRFPVVWVEPSFGWREEWLSIPAPRRTIEHPVPGLQVLPPRKSTPNLYRPQWLRRLVRGARFSSARDLLIENGVERVVLYIWRPEFADALQLVEHDFSCYHIDDEYSFSKVDRGNSPEEVRLIKSVDQVIVHSQRLFAKKGGINPSTALVPNGVDFEFYATPHQIPADLARIPGPRIGYVGVIKSQLDLELMVQIARRLPQASFVFVGPVGVLAEKQPWWDRLIDMPNVYALGNREPAQLAAYTQHMDACLMCYEVTDYTNSIYPLKLNEYLAAGRPVVSSSIDSVLPFRPTVQVATSLQDWVAALQAAVIESGSSAAAIEARRELSRPHDWDVLVGRISGLLTPRGP